MNILQKIVRDLRPALSLRQSRRALASLLRDAAELPAPADFTAALSAPGINVIAELKKASPSKGLIRADFDVTRCAVELEAYGAAALSVLTEENYFDGSLANLQAVSKLVQIPLLCKDFIIEPYQICEARLHGASAVLLIAALLSDQQLDELCAFAAELGLAVLGEAHSQEELERLLASKIRLIGINARDLKSFRCDLEGAEKLLRQIPAERIAVAESAISQADDIQRLQTAGARAFLIGESLMRAESPGNKLRELLCHA